MPIRFRCAYCNQLLGIARRKAGTVVRCPGCAGQVVVPSLEEVGGAPPSPSVPPAPAPAGAVQATAPVPQVNVFEGDIDRMLEGADQPSVIQPGPLLPQQYVAAAPVGAGGRPPGIWLSPAKATLLSVSAVVALAIAFGSGLAVGLLLARR
jgi:DNA-directed RNA polymerase subunit RPC12/RpoP